MRVCVSGRACLFCAKTSPLGLWAWRSGIMGLLFGTGVLTVVSNFIMYCGRRADLYHDLTGRTWTQFLDSSPASKRE